MMAIDLDALEAVLAKATPVPWHIKKQRPEVHVHSDSDQNYNSIWGGPFEHPVAAFAHFRPAESKEKWPGGCSIKPEDAAAIITLHNAAPALIAEHRALLARMAKLEGALRGITGIWKNSMHDDGENAAMMFEQARAALEPKL